MAIFHYTVKIVGRSKGKSIISASAYLNGDVMKNEETGRISYYTAKKEVVYTSLLMCENAPQEWLNVPAENIRRFQKSARYKRADNKDAALGKFKLTFQKQRLWNEVLKRIEDQFDLIHNNFMKRLHAKHPELSHNERMMCAYLKMNLSTKEIAPLLNISVRGVETIRYRLRKKFALEREDSLTDYLSNKL